MSEHPHISLILNSSLAFREGRLDIEGLQQNLSAVMSALEGDIHKDIHAAVRKAEAWVDSIQFTMNTSEHREAVEAVLTDLETTIRRFYPSAVAQP